LYAFADGFVRTSAAGSVSKSVFRTETHDFAVATDTDKTEGLTRSRNQTTTRVLYAVGFTNVADTIPSETTRPTEKLSKRVAVTSWGNKQNQKAIQLVSIFLYQTPVIDFPPAFAPDRPTHA